MAIFSKKENTEAQDQSTPDAVAPTNTAPLTARDVVLQPRLSEKAVALDSLNKFVFLVKRSANKLEIRKALEKFYEITIARVNIVNMRGKSRRYGRTQGRTKDFKKAIVTLTKDSKKPAILEAK